MMPAVLGAGTVFLRPALRTMVVASLAPIVKYLAHNRKTRRDGSGKRQHRAADAPSTLFRDGDEVSISRRRSRRGIEPAWRWRANFERRNTPRTGHNMETHGATQLESVADRSPDDLLELGAGEPTCTIGD